MTLFDLASRHAFLTICSAVAELTILFGVHPVGYCQFFLHVLVVASTGFLTGYHARRFVDLIGELDPTEGEDDQ